MALALVARVKPAGLMPSPIVLLGPQRPAPNLARALAAGGVSGPVALVTAGWRYDEAEIGPLEGHLPQEVVHLPLYRWFEERMAADPELALAWRARQARIRAHKALYRQRLGPAWGAVVRVGTAPVEDAELHALELEDAVVTLRRLDERVPEQSRRIKAAAGLAAEPWRHPALARHHAVIARTLQGCEALLLAGGHVAVLLSRLEAFGLGPLVADFLDRGGSVVAWGAGAMVLGRRVVLYYDDPPEGPSEPEVLDAGLDLLGELTVFPHARQRLRTGDRERLRLLQARFGHCRGLEAGAWLERTAEGEWVDHSPPGTAPVLAPGGEA